MLFARLEGGSGCGFFSVAVSPMVWKLFRPFQKFSHFVVERFSTGLYDRRTGKMLWLSRLLLRRLRVSPGGFEKSSRALVGITVR